MAIKRLTSYFTSGVIHRSSIKSLSRQLPKSESGRNFIGHPHRRKSVKQKIRSSLIDMGAIGAANGVRLKHLARQVNRRYGSWPAPLYTESLVCHVAKRDWRINHRPYRKYSVR